MMKFPWQCDDLLEIWRWPMVTVLKMPGWWAEYIENTRLRKTSMRLRYLLYTINVWFSTSFIIQVFINLSNGSPPIDELYNVFCFLPSCVGLFKIYNIIKHRTIIKQCMDQLDEMLADNVGGNVDSELEVQIRSGYRTCWIVYWFTLYPGFLTNVAWMSGPLIFIFHGEKTAMVSTWPHIFDTWVGFVVTYIIQGTCIFIIGSSVYIFDNLFFCIAHNLLIQFDILNYNLSKLGTPQAKTLFSKGLESCIEHHQKIIKVCHLLKQFTDNVIFVVCCYATLLLCFGTFSLTKGTINSSQVINLVLLSFMTVIALFCICWYGNELTFQCRNVLGMSYMSEWLDSETSDKKNLLILMARSMKPVMYGGILEISLDTFITVMKTTFSYYNFLDAVDTA